MVVDEQRELPGRLGRTFGQLALGTTQLADGGFRRLQPRGHDVLGRRLRTRGQQRHRTRRRLRLNHHDRNIGAVVEHAAGHHHVEGRPLQLGMGREGDPGPVHKADPGGTDGTGERQPGERGRRAGRIDRDDVVQGVRIEGENRCHDLDLVTQPLDERRPQRPVDQTTGEDRVLTRPTLAPEERAGDAPGRVHPLLDIHRQRKEVELLLGLLADGRGRQHHGVAEIGNCRTGSLPSQPTRLKPDRPDSGRSVVDNRFSRGCLVLHSNHSSSHRPGPSCRGGRRSVEAPGERHTAHPDTTTEDRRLAPSRTRSDNSYRRSPSLSISDR